MTVFTKLERAALCSIFSETPKVAKLLESQLLQAVVTNRRNSGAGFFTNISVAIDVPATDTGRVLGYETHARVAGIEHGLGFVLFMNDGRLHLLEGYLCGDGSTESLDLFNVDFEIFRAPIRQIDQVT